MTVNQIKETLKRQTYLEPIRISTMEHFFKNILRLLAVKDFRKNLHRRCSTRF